MELLLSEEAQAHHRREVEVHPRSAQVVESTRQLAVTFAQELKDMPIPLVGTPSGVRAKASDLFKDLCTEPLERSLPDLSEHLPVRFGHVPGHRSRPSEVEHRRRTLR